MADKGLPEITFNSVTYDATDCIQAVSFSDGANDLTYNCDGYVKHIGGNRTVQLTFSLALSKTDTTKVGAFIPGTAASAEYHPAGDTATYIEHTTTNATVISYNETGGSGNIITCDVVLAWDDRTSGAAV